MNVSLPEPLEEFVRRKVAAGEFQSVDEVVCEGLRLLQQDTVWKADARQKIAAGWEQAQAGELRSAEDVRASLAMRKREWQKSPSSARP